MRSHDCAVWRRISKAENDKAKLPEGQVALRASLRVSLGVSLRAPFRVYGRSYSLKGLWLRISGRSAPENPSI